MNLLSIFLRIFMRIFMRIFIHSRAVEHTTLPDTTLPDTLHASLRAAA